MNTLIFFLAGVSLGLVADKLYHSFVVIKKQSEEVDKEGEVETIEEKVSEVEEETVEEQVDKNETAKIEVEEPTRTEDIPRGAEERRDDLSQLKGVGPKLADALDEIGIYNYQQLSTSSVDMLLEQLRETGGRFSRPAISSIVERAQLAANEKKSQ